MTPTDKPMTTGALMAQAISWVRAEMSVDEFRAAIEQYGRKREAAGQSFDAWQANPYTQALQKSIQEDYVPREEQYGDQREAAGRGSGEPVAELIQRKLAGEPIGTALTDRIEGYAENYVAWLRFTASGTIQLCDSDADGAFKAYRHVAPQQSQEPLSARQTTARWYCMSNNGQATLCVDEEDARANVMHCDQAWPAGGPHRAVQLVEAQSP